MLVWKQVHCKNKYPPSDSFFSCKPCERVATTQGSAESSLRNTALHYGTDLLLLWTKPPVMVLPTFLVSTHQNNDERDYCEVGATMRQAPLPKIVE
jgi:hypothetical protein